MNSRLEIDQNIDLDSRRIDPKTARIMLMAVILTLTCGSIGIAGGMSLAQDSCRNTDTPITGGFRTTTTCGVIDAHHPYIVLGFTHNPNYDFEHVGIAAGFPGVQFNGEARWDDRGPGLNGFLSFP